MNALGEFLGASFNRLFWDARAVARAKLLAFTTLLIFLGLGFVLKLKGANFRVGTTGPVEVIFSSPNLTQTVLAVTAFLFFVCANIYTRVTIQEHKQKILELAADPNTPQDVRDAILQRLQCR